MRRGIEIEEVSALSGPFERECDEDCFCNGKDVVRFWVRGEGVESEFKGPVPACGRGGAVDDVLGGEEWDEELGGPASAEDE